MTVSLLTFFLMLGAQSTPAEPAEVSVETSVAVQAEAETPEEDEPLVCRRKLIKGAGLNGRHKVVKVCKSKEEWAEQGR